MLSIMCSVILVTSNKLSADQQPDLRIEIDANLTSYQVSLVNQEIVAAKSFLTELDIISHYPSTAKLLIVSNYLQFISIQNKLWGETISHSAFYDVESQQMVVYFDDSTQTLLQRVRHESIHMLLKNKYPRTPLWFHEGLAEFYEHLNSEPAEKKSLGGMNSLVSFKHLLDRLDVQTELDVEYFNQALVTITFLYNNRHQPEVAEVIRASINNESPSTHSIQSVNQRWLAQ
jgi:hypothetical protein